jgi:hypothetical protein
VWSGKLDYDAGRKDRAQGKLTKLNETHQDAFSQIALGNMYDYQHSNTDKAARHALSLLSAFFT